VLTVLLCHVYLYSEPDQTGSTIVVLDHVKSMEGTVAKQTALIAAVLMKAICVHSLQRTMRSPVSSKRVVLVTPPSKAARVPPAVARATVATCVVSVDEEQDNCEWV